MGYVDFLSSIHKRTTRDYLGRVNEGSKAEYARLAKQFGKDYWDGSRSTGYGGYHYDGRWEAVADQFIDYYKLKPGDKVLDVGCGKGFLVFELFKKGLDVYGLDISEYAIQNAKEEVRSRLKVGVADTLPYEDQKFDLVYSINTLHNLYCYNLKSALKEIQRVGNKHRYICVESYRNEEEKVNLLYWQLTCEMFCTPEEWEWWFSEAGYTGDYSFIFFEDTQR